MTERRPAEVTSDGEIIVRMRHVRAARLCAGGSRAWFTRHGLSWSTFLSYGLPVSALRSLKDPLADRAIVEAEKEHADGKR